MDERTLDGVMATKIKVVKSDAWQEWGVEVSLELCRRLLRLRSARLVLWRSRLRLRCTVHR